MGHLLWVFGDAHIYQHPTHVGTVEALCNASMQLPLVTQKPTFHLVYKPKTSFCDLKSVPDFCMEDFVMEGSVPSPVVTTKPLLIA